MAKRSNVNIASGNLAVLLQMFFAGVSLINLVLRAKLQEWMESFLTDEVVNDLAAVDSRVPLIAVVVNLA